MFQAFSLAMFLYFQDILLVNSIFSGKKENPLLLLEQYSDDELDEECSKHPIQTAEENVSIDPLVQVL